jgi:hypothetical protein
MMYIKHAALLFPNGRLNVNYVYREIADGHNIAKDNDRHRVDVLTLGVGADTNMTQAADFQ